MSNVIDTDRIEIRPRSGFGLLHFHAESWRYTYVFDEKTNALTVRVYKWTVRIGPKRSFIGWKRIAMAAVPEQVKAGISILGKYSA